MKWVRGEQFHPYEYRFFEGGGFPATLTCDDFTATLKTSFRVWLKFDQLLQAKQIGNQERLGLALNLCIEKSDGEFPLEKLMQGLIWFHQADNFNRSWLFESPKMKKHKELYEKMLTTEAKKKPGMSLLWDTGAIWGAFMSAFGIDLFRVDLHWWAFLALMRELPENCSLNRLIRQRTTDIKDVDKKEQSAFVIKQHLVSVPSGGLLEGDHD